MAPSQSLYKAVLEIERLRAALREIAAMCPDTSDMTLAHAMAQIAEEAITGDRTGPGKP